MNTEQTNLSYTSQQSLSRACRGNACLEQNPDLSARGEMQAAYAEALLDQVDTVQMQIRDLQEDLSLLQTAENALDLMSENLAKVRRLITEKQTCSSSETTAALLDEVRNLLMVNMLVAEDSVLNGHCLFRDDIIRMNSDTNGTLTLTTTRIPEIAGIDTNDTQTMLDSLNSAARTINRQYQRIGTLTRELRQHYMQLQAEAALLANAQLLFQHED
jgi:flagellin-like hook-associated protein FlgL